MTLNAETKMLLGLACLLSLQACTATPAPQIVETEHVLSMALAQTPADASDIVVWPVGIRADGLNEAMIDIAVKGPYWSATSVAERIQSGIDDDPIAWVEVERVHGVVDGSPIRLRSTQTSSWPRSYQPDTRLVWDHALRIDDKFAVLAQCSAQLGFLNYIRPGNSYRIRLKAGPGLDRIASGELTPDHVAHSLHIDTEWRTFVATNDWINAVPKPVHTGKVDLQSSLSVDTP